MKFKQKEEIYPCFACFRGEHGVDPFLTSANAVDSRFQSPFAWKHPGDFPPILDAEIPPHLPSLDTFNIPYVVDIHAHFFPDIVLKLIWKWFDSVHWAIAYRLDELERVKALRKNKIYTYTTLNYAHKPQMASWLNDWTYANFSNWEGAIPFGTFYPEPGALEYVTKAVEQYKFKGFKLHCEVGKFDLNDKGFGLTFNYLQENNIPIVIHTGNAPLKGEFTGVTFFKQLMNTYPRLRVVIAHMGANEISEYSDLLLKYESLALDTTMVFVDFLATGSEVDEAIPLLEKFQDRVYFGSDFPNIPYNLSHPIENLLSLPISKEAKRKILYENGKRLLAD